MSQSSAVPVTGAIPFRPPEPDVGLTASVWLMLALLLAVGIGLALTAFRRNHHNAKSGEAPEVLHRVAALPGMTLVAVRYRGREFLLAHSRQQTTVVASFDPRDGVTPVAPQ